MSDRGFVDHYEVLQLSPNANAETVERVYRLLAKRYHPDNLATGDAERFTEIRESYEILRDPDKRAAYDSTYEDGRSRVWQIFDQVSAHDGREQDRRMFHGILSLLYVARRGDVRHPGLGTVYLEKMLGCPAQHLDFPIWYLKQKKWIETLDDGRLAITADGVDKLADREFELRTDRLLGAERNGENGEPRELPGPAAGPEADRTEASQAAPEKVADDEIPDGSDFLDEAFADDVSAGQGDGRPVVDAR